MHSLGAMTSLTEQVQCISVVCYLSLSFLVSHLVASLALTFSIRGLGFSLHPPGALTLSAMTPSLIVFAPSHAYFFFSPGLALGGVWGLREGARRPLAVSNVRLRINSILNSVTRRGTFIGNSAGVLGWCLPPACSFVFALTPSSSCQHLYITGSTHQSTLCGVNMTRWEAWWPAGLPVRCTSQQVRVGLSAASCFSNLIYALSGISWREARLGRCSGRIIVGRRLELCQAERIILSFV